MMRRTSINGKQPSDNLMMFDASAGPILFRSCGRVLQRLNQAGIVIVRAADAL